MFPWAGKEGLYLPSIPPQAPRLHWLCSEGGCSRCLFEAFLSHAGDKVICESDMVGLGRKGHGPQPRHTVRLGHSWVVIAPVEILADG